MTERKPKISIKYTHFSANSFPKATEVSCRELTATDDNVK